MLLNCAILFLYGETWCKTITELVVSLKFDNCWNNRVHCRHSLDLSVYVRKKIYYFNKGKKLQMRSVSCVS